MTAPLVQAERLSVHFRQAGALFGPRRPPIRAVDDVSFAIARGETLGLVGESGCGKTTLGRSILRLTEPTAGTVRFDGQDLTRLPAAMLRRKRRHMQMVFQDPTSSLNPRMTVAELLAEPLTTHGLASGAAMQARVAALLDLVGLDPGRRDDYPHAFSGGQKQRIGIARALAAEPDFLVCDEATSALDVSIRAQILNLLAGLKQRLGLTFLFISHDLGVIRHVSDRIGVMYLGRIVEIGPAAAVFGTPAHPYTHALISAVPSPDPAIERQRRRIVLQGDIPSPAAPPSGCAFHTRCWLSQRLGDPARCRTEAPRLTEVGPQHRTACHFVAELRAQPSAAPAMAAAAQRAAWRRRVA
jgi:oligopeptide/dipeptide ABC transporter ATP-binding protein